MNRILAAATLALATASFSFRAVAQAAPDFPAAAPAAPASSTPSNPRLSPAARAREERRQRMSPDEARRDQQLEVLEARAGGGTSNTTFGRQASQSRQYESSAGGFKLKKFKDKRTKTKIFKRGQTRAGGSVDPKGKPLNHNNKGRKHFGIF